MRAKWFVLLSAILAASVSDITLALAMDVIVTRNGQNASIAEAGRQTIAQGMLRLFVTCSLNSRDHPEIFRSRNLETVWGKVLDKDHMYVRLDEVMNLELPGSRTVPVQEMILGLAEARYPGPEVSRHEGSIVAYEKCSGFELIRFVCTPGIKEIVPERYHELCR
jgi:hypothetical protein